MFPEIWTSYHKYIIPYFTEQLLDIPLILIANKPTLQDMNTVKPVWNDHLYDKI